MRAPALPTLALAVVVLATGCVGPAAGPGSGVDADTGTAGADTPVAPEDPRASFDWSKPHVHDYWGGEMRVTLMDQPVDAYLAHNHAFDQPPRDLHTHGCEGALVSRSQGGSVVFTLPPGFTVYPGTERLDVDLSWTDATITGVLLRYRSPAVRAFVDAGVLAAGEGLSIPLTRDMTDQGHESRSRWEFALCAWSESGRPVDVADGSVHVRMSALRVDGPLPLDPGHPDHWGDADHVLVGNASWSGPGAAAAWKGENDWAVADLTRVVPWDARAVHFTCEGEATGPAGAPVVEAWYATPARESEWAFAHVALTDGGEGVLEAVVPIEAADADGVYGTESHWDVWFRLRGGMETQVPPGLGWWTEPTVVSGALACTVHAMREVA